jgi:hypothetical protein
MKPVLFIFLMTLLHCAAYADDSPPWMRGDMPEKSNSSYYFKVTSGTGATPHEARNNAILALVGELSRAKGVTVRGSDLMQSIAVQDRKYSEQTMHKSTYVFETESFKTAFEVEDEYVKGQTCWALFEVAYDPERVMFDKVEFTTNYKGAALWRSIFVPGWGQMYKRSTGKGIALLSAEIAGIAGFFVCDNLSNSYYNKAMVERNSGVRDQYQNLSSTYRNIRNGFIIAASAVYVYNIVDAISAKGAKRYKVGVSPSGIVLSFNLQ